MEHWSTLEMAPEAAASWLPDVSRHRHRAAAAANRRCQPAHYHRYAGGGHEGPGADVGDGGPAFLRCRQRQGLLLAAGSFYDSPSLGLTVPKP
jgi:hypothetical protein